MNFEYGNDATSENLAVEQLESQNRGSFRSLSTFSQDAFQCSPGMLALKKKYADSPIMNSETNAPRESVKISDGVSEPSFEFKPHEGEDGQADGAEMEVDSAEKDDISIDTPRPVSPLSRISMGGDGQSPRFSFSLDQSRFGSPFRSPQIGRAHV